MRYILILLALLITNVVQAMDCQTLPDCASLGYSKDDDPNCAENGYMYCPFDQDYKVCVQYNCEALGFTESDKTSWCADLIKCKGNEKMTLCQKPCFATDYNSLKELAGSSKCKVVTLRDDIEMPQNQGITLAANTIIDGGNHTLSSSGNNKNFNVYTLNNNTGFKNIFIKHDQTETQQGLTVFQSTNGSKSTLQNIQVEAKSDDKKDHACALFRGAYEISDRFKVDIHAIWHWGLGRAVYTFKNANINVTVEGHSGDAFIENVDFINSQGTITTGGVSMINEYTLTFENSNIHLNVPSASLLWTDSGRTYATILLKDKAEVKLTFKMLVNGHGSGIAHIKFGSSETTPATLIVEGDQKLDSADVTANNTANTVVLNGVTCHPKKSGTTLLSEIQTSDDWTCAQ